MIQNAPIHQHPNQSCAFRRTGNLWNRFSSIINTVGKRDRKKIIIPETSTFDEPDHQPSGQTQQQQPTQQPTQQQTPQGGDTTQTQQPQQNKDGWNQAFYETLTPEQQETYKNLPDASYRNMMQQKVEKARQREAEGWVVNAGTPTEEQLEEAWGNMTFGQ